MICLLQVIAFVVVWRLNRLAGTEIWGLSALCNGLGMVLLPLLTKVLPPPLSDFTWWNEIKVKYLNR